MDQQRIRNFCIIAHIDHGKSTLADRLLEATGTVEWVEGRGSRVEQVLDQMDLEREKGVTIKAKAVRMTYAPPPQPAPGTRNTEQVTRPPPGPGVGGEALAPSSRFPVPGEGRGEVYELNLIDTPGHVDFAYEVSRALSACEGAILVVDAAQGVQAQTLANVYAAWEHDLKLIPVVNKIDLPSAEPERVAQELTNVLGFAREEIIFASAKEGVGTDQVLEAVVDRVPPPAGRPDAPLRALIFDSKYDAYKGVIAYVRVVDGSLFMEQPLCLMASERTVGPLEVGVLRPDPVPVEGLTTGQVGYVATGLKNVGECRVGDTITDDASPAAEPLPGYRPAKPMVWAGLYPAQPNDYGPLRDALDKLSLNDASLAYEPESSTALGFGFRCGFLGLLHMEIVQERLEREYGLSLLTTAPSVEYQVRRTDGTEMVIDNPADLPPPNEMLEIREPCMNVSIITPDRYVGPIMELATARRGQYKRMDYLEGTGNREPGTRMEGLVSLEYQIPLSETLVDFYDQLKSRTQGYATMDYTFSHYAPAKLVKLDILVNYQPVDALSIITTADKAKVQGRALVERLRRVIPRQLFDVALQASIGGRVVARETIRAMRKNVLAKCYGGDVTRKRKLLEKQAEGKRRMKRLGNVEIPQEAFTAVLKLEK